MLALSLELRDCGHDVVLATTESYQNKIENLGFEFHAIRPNLPEDPQLIGKMMDPKTGSKTTLKDVVWVMYEIPMMI